MNKQETLSEIRKYLSNDAPYARIPDVVQWSEFIAGIFIVQSKGYNVRFAPAFLEWLDSNEMWNVYLSNVMDDVYTIVVKDEK